MTSVVSSASETLTSTTSTKRGANGSPLASSTPRSLPPHERDPWLFALTGIQGSFQLQEIPCVYRPRDKWCHCTGNLIQASVWEIVGVSGVWRVLTNQILYRRNSAVFKNLYYIHQTLLLHLLRIWERHYHCSCAKRYHESIRWPNIVVILLLSLMLSSLTCFLSAIPTSHYILLVLQILHYNGFWHKWYPIII